MSSPQPDTAGETHQAQQALIAAGVAGALLSQAWPLLDPHDLSGTLPAFREAVRAVVQRYGRASAAAALNYYRAARRAAGIPGRPNLTVISDVQADQIASAVSWATTDLWGATDPAVALATAQDRMAASAERVVLNQGRNELLGYVGRDREATGWARVPEASACSFCLMLSIRGPVFESEDSAGRAANDLVRKNGRKFANHYLTPSEFKVHDHCRCHVEPVFGRYDMPLQVRAAKKLWASSTHGKTGADARNAFRQAVEGREVTGLTRGKHAPATPKPVEISPATAAKLIAGWEKSIARMRANNGGGKLSPAIGVLEGRIRAARAAVPVAA